MADRPSNNSEEQPNNNNNNSSSSSSSSNDDDDGGITEGRLVQVASRTWPGINKPGGVARVTMVVHSNNNNGGGGGLLRSHVDVQYIVGNGKEKRVPIEYVQLAPQYETSRDDCSRRTNAAASLRDRSMLLGRCRQCGSLRTDCGSCDWATEEQQVVVLSTTAAAAAAASTKPPRTKHKPSRVRKSVASKDDDDDDDDVSLSSSSSSSSSSDEEDVLLQELVEKNQRQYRKYLKSKQKWNRYYHRHDTKTSEPKQPTSDNDDDDDDDDDMSELLEQRDQRYKRYLQMKSKWKQLPSSMSLDDKSGQEKMQRRRRRHRRHRYQHQPSVLEVATHRQAPTKLNTQTLRVGNQDDRNDNSRQDLNVTTTTTTTPKKRKPTTTSREQGSDTRMDDNDNDNDNGYLQVSPVGVAESSSPESFSQQHNSYYNDNDNGDGDDHWPPEQSYFLDSAGLDDDPDGDNVGMRLLPEEEEESNNNTLALSQFIQPEGRDAAENLPEDTLDRTQNLPYHRLPQFFDTMATQLEDTKLPDFKLRVADLQRQWRQILDVTQRRKRRTSLFSSNEEQQQEDTPSSRISSKSLLEECIQTWHQVRIKLIRNGTDQARAALRRLLDDRLYRRHRKTMTPQQRKQCRGSALEDARNLRMDALENAVEGLVRKLKEICQDCEQQQQQQVADEAADGDDSVSAASFQEEPYQTQDLVPLEDSTVDGSLTHGEEQGLAPFHPHMHASRKKTTTTIKAVHQQKRARHKGTSVNTNKKRLKSSSRSHQTVVEVGSENPQQSDVSQPPNQQHPNNDTSTMDVTTDRESFESSGIPILGHSQEDEDDDEVPTFNLFDTEAAEGGPPSRMNDRNLVRANGLPNLNRRRRAGATASNLSEEPQPSHYRSRSNAVPISQRMQAFLDANSGNGLDYLINDAEGEGGNENNQKQRRVRELQQRRQRSRVQSNSSDRSRITGVRSGRNVRSERGNRRSAQERNGANNGSIGDESQDRLINDDLDHNLPVSPEGEPIDALSLFSQLEANMPASGEPRNETVLLAGHNKPDISVLCAELDRSYPNSSQSCFAALKNLHYLLGLDETADAKATFLQNALALLQNHGTVTLQELISTKSSQLSVHVRLLSECLYALHIEPNNNLLDPHHGPVSEILLANNRRNFVDFLVLQLVDSIYSLLHPSAWALDIGNHQTQILQILNPLRDALARLIPLTESVCRCVVERFGCQEWRQGVINRGHAFVSSVAPSDWKTYLETGKYPERPPEGTIRYQQIGKVWPRMEVDALWGLLAYVGAAASRTEDRSFVRWHVVSKLFSASVLAGIPNEIDACNLPPPSEAQLLACEKEIGFLTKLLSRGSMNDLPSSDSMVINLIRRSLTLQGDDYFGNADSRARCYPILHDRKSEKKLVSRLWKATHPLFFIDAASVECDLCSVFDIEFPDSVMEGMPFKLQSLLVPSSKVLRQCLGLLPAWIQRVSEKKVRQTRLLKSLNSLTTSLVEQATKAEDQISVHSNDSNSFANAFAVMLPVDSGNRFERKSIFLREAAALLKTVAILSKRASGRNTEPSKTSILSAGDVSQIWLIVANDPIKKRQDAIMKGGKECEDFLGVDSFRAYTAARVMAFLVFVQMNVSPWNLNVGKKITRLFGEALSQSELEKECYSFPVSCIFACLDCLCGAGGDSHLMVQLYSLIALVFTNMTALVELEGCSPAIDHLKTVAISSFTPMLIRCFKIHVNSAGAPEDFLALRLLLCSMRAIISFAAICSQKGAPGGTENAESESSANEINTGAGNAESDDLFGSLDDAAFASIDLDCFGTSNVAPLRCIKKELCLCLTDALRQSKPSERFAIHPTNQSQGSMQISVHGKHMISKEIDRICDCLVSLVTTELEKDKIEEILDIISPLIRVFHEDNNDEQFSIQIARRLSSELCSFSKNYSICRHFVSINSEAILFNFIQTLLDANRIEIFPSCNLERIEGVAGEVAAQQALTLLDLFNDDFSHEPSEGENWRDSGVVAGIRIQQRRRNKAASVWGFCRNLGAAFSEVDHAEVGNRFNSSALSLGAVLLALDNDLSRRPGSSLNSLSLEKEVLECFQLLRNLVSAAAKSDVSNHFTFERVSAFSITVVITHILRTVRSLKYHDQTCAGSSQEKEKDFRRAGISELLSCFSELLVALSTWILRESGHSGSQSWSLFLGLLRDKLICPVLRKQHLDLTISLQQILLASTSVLTGTSQRSMSTVIGLPGCSKYLEEVFDSIIRRSGQLLIAASRSQDMSIQSSLAEAVIAADGQAEDQIAFCVGTSFQSSFFSSRRLSFRSPLQKGIDEYIRFVEKELPRDPELEVNMRKIKICFLSTFAVPRLNHKQTSLETKRRVLLLATHVLASNMHQAKRIDYSPMESGILCTLVKGISASLIQCLEKCVVDDSFVCALLSCSSNLANVSLTCEEGKNLSLISWSRNAVDLSNNKTLLDVTNNEINAAYSWVFFKWLQSLAASIVAFHEGGHDNQEKLQSVRKNFIGRECKDLEGDALSIDFEFSKLHQQRDFDDWDLLLRRLQKNVFPSKTENNPNIVNVYAKTRPANSKGSRSIEQWVPSPAAKRTAKEFMAEIIPLS